MSIESSVNASTDLTDRDLDHPMKTVRAKQRPASVGDGASVIDRMEDVFERRGFASTSVDELRDAAGVSLRTLYRRYGSREQMVVSVLRNRAERYLAYLAGAPDVRSLFERTGTWLEQNQPLGCLFLRARADHPDDPAVDQAVVSFHTALHSRLSTAAQADGLGDDEVAELFVLHEGLLAAAPAVGVPAARAAVDAALTRLLSSSG